MLAHMILGRMEQCLENSQQKNNTGFGVVGGLRNIWLQPICLVTSSLPPTGHYGLSA